MASSPSDWTRESAVDAVKNFYERTGRQPVTFDAYSRNRLPSTATAVKLFGSWNKLIQASGFEPIGRGGRKL